MVPDHCGGTSQHKSGCNSITTKPENVCNTSVSAIQDKYNKYVILFKDTHECSCRGLCCAILLALVLPLVSFEHGSPLTTSSPAVKSHLLVFKGCWALPAPGSRVRAYLFMLWRWLNTQSFLNKPTFVLFLANRTSFTGQWLGLFLFHVSLCLTNLLINTL